MCRLKKTFSFIKYILFNKLYKQLKLIHNLYSIRKSLQLNKFLFITKVHLLIIRQILLLSYVSPIIEGVSR